MKDTIKQFKTRMKKEGRTFKWFHGKYIKGISYVYFMIQLHDNDRISDAVLAGIKKFLSEK